MRGEGTGTGQGTTTDPVTFVDSSITTTFTTTSSCLAVAVAAGNAEAVTALMATTSTATSSVINNGVGVGVGITATANGPTTSTTTNATAAIGSTTITPTLLNPSDSLCITAGCVCGRARPPGGGYVNPLNPSLSLSGASSNGGGGGGGGGIIGSIANVRPSARLSALGLSIPSNNASDTGLGGGVEVRVGAVVTDLMNATRCALTQSQGRVDALIAALDYTFSDENEKRSGGEREGAEEQQGFTKGREQPVEVVASDSTVHSTSTTPTTSFPPDAEATRMKSVVPALISLVRACVRLDALDTPLCHLQGLGKAHCLKVEEMVWNIKGHTISATNTTITTSTTTATKNTDPILTLEDTKAYVAIIEAARVLMMLPTALGDSLYQYNVYTRSYVFTQSIHC